MAYKIVKLEELTIIEDTTTGSTVSVRLFEKALLLVGRAYCLATQYEIKGGFVPKSIWVFEALTAQSLDELKHAVDFHFNNLFDTELYVKEVPGDSSLYVAEALRLYGTPTKNLDGLNCTSISNGGADKYVA